ncbi:hypothetical protein RLIN73S_00652 [Rhodanobacter lindaniclasticus]
MLAQALRAGAAVPPVFGWRVARPSAAACTARPEPRAVAASQYACTGRRRCACCAALCHGADTRRDVPPPTRRRRSCTCWMYIGVPLTPSSCATARRPAERDLRRAARAPATPPLALLQQLAPRGHAVDAGRAAWTRSQALRRGRPRRTPQGKTVPAAANALALWRSSAPTGIGVAPRQGPCATSVLARDCMPPTAPPNHWWCRRLFRSRSGRCSRHGRRRWPWSGNGRAGRQ